MSEHRIGTCYIDPDTGEYVMPPDWYGEKEIRWMNVSTPQPDSHSDGVQVPFAVQDFMFESLAECSVLVAEHLFDTHFKTIIELARERFHKGYATYGSQMYGWSRDERLQNVLEELADAVVYLTSGPIE
jgi:hypothetical protein